MQSVAELPFIAGHVALDFVNTAEGRGDENPGEALRTAADLRQWGERRGVLDAGGTAKDGTEGDEDDELSAALDARELLYRLFLDRSRGHGHDHDHGRDHGRDHGHGHGQGAQSEDLAALARIAAGAYQAAHLNQAADGRLSWGWDRAELSTVRYAVLVSAVDLLSQSPAARLKQCPGDNCGWFFIDSTKRGNRRWCSMSECGQQAKTARRRQRPAARP